ncbi:MAG: hypothetical protein ACR2QM_14455 [Longimicrobiales bacterium]
MKCRQFLDAYTEFRDGRLEEGPSGAMAEHLAACTSCARYDEVLSEGVAILRTLELEPTDPIPVGRVERMAFRWRQDQLADGGAPGMSSSAFAAAAAGLLAAVFAAVTWLPGLTESGTPELDLSPVVATAPGAQAPAARRGYFPTPAALPFEAAPEGFQALSRSLLYQYGGPGPSRALVAASPRLD